MKEKVMMISSIAFFSILTIIIIGAVVNSWLGQIGK